MTLSIVEYDQQDQPTGRYSHIDDMSRDDLPGYLSLLGIDVTLSNGAIRRPDHPTWFFVYKAPFRPSNTEPVAVEQLFNG